MPTVIDSEVKPRKLIFRIGIGPLLSRKAPIYRYKVLHCVVLMARGKNGRSVGGTAARYDMLSRCRDTLYGLRQDYAGMSQTAEEMVDRAGARIHALVL